MSKNIRIRTTPNGGDNQVKIQLTQDFDFLEILSLKISQEDVYRNFYSDYGVVVGRVSINNGVGIPNAKVTVFIPLTDEDSEDIEISSIYPYSDISIINSDGIRFNTLPSEIQGECHTPVGTLPNKGKMVDNEKLLGIYNKYYKYSTTTNDSGDFMIFGVPVGNHILNVDVDLSDIGIYSQRPYDFIDQGNPTKLFESPTKFKAGNNLNNLTQLKNQQIGVNIIPFWGETLDKEVGITRIDVDLNYTLTPKAIFMGSIFGDTEKNSVNKTCRPRKKLGKICEMSDGGGTVQMLRKTLFGENERYDIEGGKVVNDFGAWAYQIPMNLDYMVTDEYGDLVPTEDTNKGIPTRARMRFKIDTDITGGEGRVRTRAKHLVPHNPSNNTEIDYTFDDSTSDEHFRDMYWNKIYTVKNFIGRFQRNDNLNNRNFIGFKDVDDCVGLKNPIPFNSLDTDLNPLYTILCFIAKMIIDLIYGVNKLLGIRIWPLTRFCTLLGVDCLGFELSVCSSIRYAPGCHSDCRGRGNSNVGEAKQCVSLALAEALNVFEFEFHNEWINGSLYAFLLKYKKKKKDKEKFCGDGDGDGDNYLLNVNITTSSTSISTAEEVSISEGVIVSFEDELFYKPITKANNIMYATDIYNLGSVFDCDWQGLTKAHVDLLPTTYQIPTFVDDEEDETVETPIAPLLFNIDCFKITANDSQSKNIRRLCEIGVGGDIGDSANGVIDEFDISNKLLRNKLIKLNDSLLVNKPLRDINSDFDEPDYNSYRGIKKLNNFTQPFGDSFYFYFGPKPSSTALELMNSKYFTTCDELSINLIIINGNVNDVTTVNGSDGSIDITVQGGTEPYTYLWSNGEISQNINGLLEGSYYVIVTDNNGRSSKKTFIVRGLKPLVAYVTTKNAIDYNTANGQIIIKSIIGGIGPYNVNIVGTSTNITHNDVTYSLIEKDLAIGEYTVTITDKNLDLLIYEAIISVPAELLIIDVVSTNLTCFDVEDGTISFNIQGGTAEYYIVVENLGTGNKYYTNSLINLKGGDYSVNVTDSFDQSATIPDITLIEPEEIVLTINGATLSFGPTVNGVDYDLLLDSSFLRTLTGNGRTVTTQADAGSGLYQITTGGSCTSNGVAV